MEIALKKLVAAAMGLCLMVGGAFALTTPLTDIEIPGVDAMGGLDDVNTGLASGKAKVNESKGTFSAKLKGTAPNASESKAKFEYSFSEQAMGYTAVGDAKAKYSKPKSKLEGDSKASVKAKGTLEE